MNSVSNGAPVEITLDAVSGKTYHGTVYTVANAADSSEMNTTFSATVAVDDPDDRMFAGMTAEVSMAESTKEGVLLVPSSALNYDNDKVTLTVAGDNGNKTVEVKIGTVSGSISELVSGDVKEGDRVVVSSVSSEVLEELGLDPADYISEPSAKPEMPAGEQMPPQDGGTADQSK